MIITYHGGECFKVSFGDTALAINPISKESKLRTVRFGADIAIVSLNDKDFNGIEQIAHGEKKPFVISGVGEYEVKKVFVKGFPSVSQYGGEERINTIYSIHLEGMNLVFLGALSTKKTEAQVKEALGDIDVLFLPIGGNGVLDASAAHALSVELEPKIVIPMHYGEIEEGGKGKALAKFLKEDGEENGKQSDRLTIKKKDLEGKEGEIIVLKI
ncbi:MAG: MBL fold metallo-hydrolase [Candidatus Pacebacteria bacterium]|jgi:L-ascorbate metabolism protein UlaG (beta-lactamase superfamily)|nr:MBL fold metallo-hydrolase [Candidatus Paceibacterota bacterium]|tara:strand:+ start:19483 stop:20124 length:642 start_codon:yes stop_codon:yes gene_type:complete